MLRMPWVLLGVLVVVRAGAAHATCPESVADCLGAAAGFSIVAERLTINKGITGDEGFSGPRRATVGDACAPTAVVGGPVDCETTVQNLILLAPDGVAATFVGTPSYCSAGLHPGIGVIVSQDVVTGGGALRNPGAVSILGVVDTSGTDPRLATCAQAISDMQITSTMLAALPPTRNLGTIRLRPYDSQVLIADPGVNVWTADRILLPSKRSPFSAYTTTHLGVVLDPATVSVVINVGSMSVGRYSSFSGDPSKVIVNLVGRGTLSTRGYHFGPPVISAGGTIKVKPIPEGTVLANGAYARRVEVFGGVVP